MFFYWIHFLDFLLLFEFCEFFEFFWCSWQILSHVTCQEIPRSQEIPKSELFELCEPRTRREGSWTFMVWDMYKTCMRHVDSCWCYPYYRWKVSHVTHVQSLSIPWREKTLRQGEPMRPVTWAQRTICGFRCQSDSSKSIKTMVSSCFITFHYNSNHNSNHNLKLR